MSKLSLSVSTESARALVLATTPAAVKEIETLAAAAKRYAESLEQRNYAAEIVQDYYAPGFQGETGCGDTWSHELDHAAGAEVF